MKKTYIAAVLMLTTFAYAQVGLNTANPQGILHIDGAKDNNASGTPSSIQASNDVVVTSAGSMGIGTYSPSSTAILDLDVSALPSSGKKGFLAPRIGLTSLNDNATVANPANYLTVFNTATAGTVPNNVVPGYYYWSAIQSKWVRIVDTEPWNIQGTTSMATVNTDNIFQMGSVAIGKDQAGVNVALDVKGAVRTGDLHTGVTGANSVAFGVFNEASGSGSAAFGINYLSLGTANNKATGTNSIAFGRSNIASGVNSVAFGGVNKASGNYSTAFGNTNILSGHSTTSFGQENQALGHATSTFGYSNIAASPYETIVGFVNAITISSIAADDLTVSNLTDDPLFQVGNGINGVNFTPIRSNALTVLRNGKVGVGIIGIEAAAKPTEMFDLGSGNMRIRGINTITGTNTDKIVVADSNGVLKTIVQSGGTSAITTKNANYTALATDETILVNNSSSVTITLPSGSVQGKKYNIKKINATSNTLMINGGGSLIDGAPIIMGTTAFQGWVLQFDGVNWFIISRF